MTEIGSESRDLARAGASADDASDQRGGPSELPHPTKDRAGQAPAPLPIVHIAGLNLSVKAQQTRQRCAWCGAVLTDAWRHPGAPTLLAANGQPIDPDAVLYPVGSLVRITGDGSPELTRGNPLPDDFCGFLDQRLRDAPSPVQAPT